jgi:hypothetical protein
MAACVQSSARKSCFAWLGLEVVKHVDPRARTPLSLLWQGAELAAGCSAEQRAASGLPWLGCMSTMTNLIVGTTRVDNIGAPCQLLFRYGQPQLMHLWLDTAGIGHHEIMVATHHPSK